MITLHTNIFEIENLAELTSSYQLYRIKGLRPDQAQYHQNRQTLIRQLSFLLRAPVTVIVRDGQPYLVTKADAPPPPERYDLVRTPIRLELMPGEFALDYRKRSPENDIIALRFLQSLVQAPLLNNLKLWQPKAGAPFYEKQPEHETKRVALYRGFLVRATLTPGGGMGFFVDLRHRYVARRPLPARLNAMEFRDRYKANNFVYHYGYRWYDIQLTGLSDFNVQDYPLYDDDGQEVSLIKRVQTQCAKPLPMEIAQMSKDAAVVHYFTAIGEDRAAPAPLCYQVLDTQHAWVKSEHGRCIPGPHIRLGMIEEFVCTYMQKLRFGKTQLKLAAAPLETANEQFQLPDYEFGGGRILSVRGTRGATQTTLREVGNARAALLVDRGAGFFRQRSLDRQYFFMPQSVFDSWGPRFLEDLRQRVNRLYRQQHHYDPKVIPYDDRAGHTFVDQATALLEAAENAGGKEGFAVVMIHRPSDQRVRKHDQLAAAATRKLRDIGIYAAVMHTDFGEQSYVQMVGEEPGEYVPRSDTRGGLPGYLQAVAVNKVLLTSERWPFVLATPLAADIILGVDVKDNWAGFTVVANGGREIWTRCYQSRQKEKLLSDQFREYMLECIRRVAKESTRVIRTITIHRDGMLFDSERAGAEQALEILRKEDGIAADMSLTCLEIPKESAATLRLFEKEQRVHDRPRVENPILGTYYLADDSNGYVCTTGWPFLRGGTAKPLYVRKVFGPLPMKECLQDVFYLSALTWTRPDDCARDPITVKLNDRRLAEDASDFDADVLDTALLSTGVASAL